MICGMCDWFAIEKTVFLPVHEMFHFFHFIIIHNYVHVARKNIFSIIYYNVVGYLIKRRKKFVINPYHFNQREFFVEV